MHFIRFAVAGCLACGAIPAAAYPISKNLDDFSQGPATSAGVQSGLDPEHVIGGAREIVLTMALVEIDTADREASGGILAPGGSVKFKYGSVTPLFTNLRLVDGGKAVTFIDLDAELTPSITASVTVTNLSSTGLTTETKFFNNPFGAHYEIFLSEFSDLSNVQSLTLRLTSDAFLSGFTLHKFSTDAIPEPSAALLCSVALTGVIRRRRPNPGIPLSERVLNPAAQVGVQRHDAASTAPPPLAV